jgi:hypothetical protein
VDQPHLDLDEASKPLPIWRGTGSWNPFRSSGESANHRFLSGGHSFCEHHKDSIRFGYRWLDRILLNGLIQPFQQPERVVGFFDAYRQVYPVSREVLRGTAEQFQC